MDRYRDKNGNVVIDAKMEGATLPVYSPVCTFCRHLASGSDRTCGAFPSGIPPAIWGGDNPHTEPFPGDHGIRFEPREP